VREIIRAFLEADAALLAMLPGGIFAEIEISRLNTPAAFDANKELQACANVKLETRSPVGPHPDCAQQFFAVTIYQLSGFTVIDQAVQRVYELLHGQKISSLIYEVQLVDTIPEAFDYALNCSMALSRFVATYKQQ
jgi:hypothetical protein